VLSKEREGFCRTLDLITGEMADSPTVALEAYLQVNILFLTTSVIAQPVS
jgi:hypothetical protein